MCPKSSPRPFDPRCRADARAWAPWTAARMHSRSTGAVPAQGRRSILARNRGLVRPCSRPWGAVLPRPAACRASPWLALENPPRRQRPASIRGPTRLQAARPTMAIAQRRTIRGPGPATGTGADRPLSSTPDDSRRAVGVTQAQVDAVGPDIADPAPMTVPPVALHDPLLFRPWTRFHQQPCVWTGRAHRRRPVDRPSDRKPSLGGGPGTPCTAGQAPGSSWRAHMPGTIEPACRACGMARHRCAALPPQLRRSARNLADCCTFQPAKLNRRRLTRPPWRRQHCKPGTNTIY